MEKDWNIRQGDLGKGIWIYNISRFSYLLLHLLQSTHHKRGVEWPGESSQPSSANGQMVAVGMVLDMEAT